jgi:hypothetical protein
MAALHPIIQANQSHVFHEFCQLFSVYAGNACWVRSGNSSSVIPAQAGIQRSILDSRLRGNDDLPQF